MIDAAAHGKPCDGVFKLARVHEIKGFLYGQHHVIDFFRKQFIRNARISVLLMDSRGNSHSGSLPYHRAGGITACSYGNIGLEIRDYFLGALSRCCEICQRFGVSADIFYRYPALESRNFDSFNFISCLRNKLCLHAFWSTCKEKFRVGIFCSDNICDRQSGIYMTSRTSA